MINLDMKDLTTKSSRFLNKYTVILFAIFLWGLFLRSLYVYPGKIIFGYDQVIEAINARKIVDYHDIITREIGSNALGLNHGVLISYFTSIPYFLGGGRPMVIAYWYIFFNTLAAISVFFFVNSVFNNRSMAFISAFLISISHFMVLISGWISITTIALFLAPLFFLGFWFYKKGHNWALIFSMFLLGLLIQSQMLMVYNIATLIVIWIILKLKKPNLKTAALSAFSFLLATSTMILTEIRSNFSSIEVFLNPQDFLDESLLPFSKRLTLFIRDFLSGFSSNLTPGYLGLGKILGILIILIIVGYIFYHKTKKEEKYGLKLLLIFLFSPVFILFIGYHNTPWTLIGTIPAISIATGYVISKIPYQFLKIFVLGFIFLANTHMFINSYKNGDLFINQEPSSTLRGQLAVVDYTYREAKGENFAINAVSYPLYNNTYWSYHYPWYGQNHYGYLPAWLGGDQLYPYNTLVKSGEKESIFYMIIDETGAIPEVHKAVGRAWGNKYGKLLEESLIGGFTVQKFKRYN